MPSTAAAADLDAAPMSSSAGPGTRRVRRVVMTTRSTVGTPLHNVSGSTGSSDAIAKFRETMAEKTDYTYSKTGTYNVGYLQNHVVTPNLSRPYLRERNIVYVSTPGELSERRPVDFNTRSRLLKSSVDYHGGATVSECGDASAATAAAEAQLDGGSVRSCRSTYRLYSTTSNRVERRDADDGLTSSAADDLRRQLHFADDQQQAGDGMRRFEFSDYTEEEEEEDEENVNSSKGMPARTRRATSTSKSRSPQRKARARRSVAGGIDGHAGRAGGGGGVSVTGSSATLSTVTDVSKSVSMYGLDVTESEAYTDGAYSLSHVRAHSTPTMASSDESGSPDARGGAVLAAAVADAASGAYRLLVAAGQTLLKWWWTVQETVVQTIVTQSSRSAAWLAETTRRRSSAVVVATGASNTRRSCAYCCLCVWLPLLLLPLFATLLTCGLHSAGYADVPMCSRLSGIYYVDKDGVSYSSVLGERTRQIVVNLVNMGRSSSSAGAEQQQSGTVDSRIIAELDARIDRQRRQLDGSVNERLAVQLQRISEMESEIDLLRKEQGLSKNLQGEFDSLRHEVMRDLSRLGTEISRVRDAAIAENPDTQHDIASLNLQLDQLKTSLDETKKAHQLRVPLEAELSQTKNEIGKLKARLEALEAASTSTADAVAAARAPCAGADGCACRKDLVDLEKSVVHKVDAVDRRLTNAMTDAVARSALGSGTEQTNVYISAPNGTGISEEVVRDLVKKELSIYSADKTGLPDYALESIGGKVVSTRCSESYYDRAARITFLGVPLWRSVNPPNIVIQPSMVPGQCWAFRGSEGYLVVRLALTVKPTSFVIEHIPRSQSPTGSIDSAPKDFSVYGLVTETSNDLTKIGDWRYDSEGPSLQYFPVSDLNVKPYPVVELRIRSNWGNPEYTCLYRFRVHGVPVMP